MGTGEQSFESFRIRRMIMTMLLLVALTGITAVLISKTPDDPVRIGQGKVITFDVSPDGQHFAIGSVGGLYVYQVEGYQEVWSDETEAPVTDIDFSHDGKQIIASLADGRMIVWDLQLKNRSFEIQVSQEPLKSVCFSPDGTLFASGDGNGNVIIWDSTGERYQDILLPYGDEIIYDLAFSPDGSMLAAATYLNAMLIVWNATTWEELFSYERAGVHLDWSDDSSRLGTSMNGHYNVWDTATWEHLVHHVEEREFGNIVFKPDSTNFQVSGGWIRRAYSPDGRYSYSYHYFFEKFNIYDYEEETNYFLNTYKGSPRDMFFSSDGQHLAVLYQDRLTFWDVQTRTMDYEIDIPEGIQTVEASSDGTFFATGLNTTGSIVIWDMDTLKPTKRYDTAYEVVDNIAINPTSEYLVSAVMSIKKGDIPEFNSIDAYSFITWDLATGKIVDQTPERNARTCHVGFYPDSSEIWLHNYPTAWSPDGRYLASVIDDADRTEFWRDISLHDTLTGETLFTIPANSRYIEDIAFNPSGTILAMAEPDAVYLWEIPTGRLLRTLDQGGYQVVWSRDGKQLATGSPGGLVYIWHIGE